MLALGLLGPSAAIGCTAPTHDDEGVPACPEESIPGTCGAADSRLCVTDAERCHCGLGIGYWFCEPIECPEVEPEDGDPCTESGLVCGGGFENPGYRCTTGEWKYCLSAVRSGGPEAYCPDSAPSVGAPCCIVDQQWLGYGASVCRYGDEAYLCSESTAQWTRWSP